MDLGNALKRAWRDDITIRSVIANTVTQLYPRKITITSVKLSGKTILVKTWNSLINSELHMLRSDIEQECKNKLSLMWIHIDKDIVIKFL